jgi:hypothetical protein
MTYTYKRGQIKPRSSSVRPKSAPPIDLEKYRREARVASRMYSEAMRAPAKG